MSDGRIVNEDGASTRVAPMNYGPDKVFIVAGVNKIVKTQAEAVKRIKWVAPQNCKRIGFDTPWLKTASAITVCISSAAAVLLLYLTIPVYLTE